MTLKGRVAIVTGGASGMGRSEEQPLGRSKPCSSQMDTSRASTCTPTCG